jgi:hypothetical protein
VRATVVPAASGHPASQYSEGAANKKAVAEYENSNFFAVGKDSGFFSDCLLWAIPLQIEQGCFPSKVLDTASVSGET